MTREELIGRKFTTYDGTEYLIGEATHKNTFWLWRLPGKSASERGHWECSSVINNIEKGVWKLVEEKQETKMYTTPKGVSYGVGTQFSHTNSKAIYEVVEINGNDTYISSVHDKSINRQHWTLSALGNLLDNTNYTVLPKLLDYKSVDPTTIKFDFKNTKIKVSNKEESEWIQKVAFNNKLLWSGDRFVKVQITDSPFLYFNDKQVITHTTKGTEAYFSSKEYKEITIQDILTGNQMKEVIEVGDTVCYNSKKAASYGESDLRVVKSIKDDTVFFESPWGREDISKLLLVSKAPKQEIIGYELLKDLPGVKAGSRTIAYTKDSYAGFASLLSKENLVLSHQALQDTTWFKPVYKPKEVVVKISKGREVKVDSTSVHIVGHDTITHTMFKQIYDYAFPPKKFSGYELSANSIQVGCQEYTKDDILAVDKAIKSL